MAKLVRFGISISEGLLNVFDQQIVACSYANRSEAIRDLIRSRLVDLAWADGTQEVVGTITLVYDHHIRGLNAYLTELQHNWHDLIISSTHVHLDHYYCLEVLVVKGPAAQIREVSDKLIGVKGVSHGQLTITSTGQPLK